MRFVPAEESESPTDVIQSFDGLDLYIAPESASYLDGATIYYVFRFIASGISPAMAVNIVGGGSQYAVATVDAEGNYLVGGKTYRLHLP